MNTDDVAHRLREASRVLLVEAKHWQEHPDYLTVKITHVPAGQTFTEAQRALRLELAERCNHHRATHTDIVLREVAATLARLASQLEENR